MNVGYLQKILKLLSLLLLSSVDCLAWSYDDDDVDDGPNYWHMRYPACSGTMQSPIDLQPDAAFYDPTIGSFNFGGYTKEELPVNHLYELVNNGRTVQLNVNTPSITISGAGLQSTYQLQEVHMHWGSRNRVGSEHTVNKIRYPLEIHFMHFNNRQYADMDDAADQRDGLAVLAVFAQVDKDALRNEAMQSFIDQLRNVSVKNDKTTFGAFSLFDLLPTNTDTFYRYSGSLTTPPCYQSVTWTVFKDPISISQLQLNALRTISYRGKGEPDARAIPDNYRPVQPINGRLVFRSFSVRATSSVAEYSSIIETILAKFGSSKKNGG